MLGTFDMAVRSHGRDLSDRPSQHVLLVITLPLSSTDTPAVTSPGSASLTLPPSLPIPRSGSASTLHSVLHHFSEEQCTTGALLAPSKAGGTRRGGGRHRQALGRAGGVLHPRAGHRPRAVSVRPRRVPGPLVWRRRHVPRLARRSIAGRVPGHVRGPGSHDWRVPRPPHGRNAVPAFDVVLRPTKSVSILYGLGDAATGRRCCRRIMPG